MKVSERIAFWNRAMDNYGISIEDRLTLRRAEMTLSRWSELECGDGNGHIERDEKTGIPYYHNDRHSFLAYNDPRAWRRVPDRETGALRRVKAIMVQYPELTFYHQGDPRGCALYILRKSDVRGQNIDSVYSRGICANY